MSMYTSVVYSSVVHWYGLYLHVTDPTTFNPPDSLTVILVPGTNGKPPSVSSMTTGRTELNVN